MAAAKSPSPAMEFLTSALKANAKATYGDLKAKADEKGLKVYPIMFGRAQAMLGLVKSAKRGQGKAAKAKRAAAPQPARGTGRRGRQPDANSTSGKIRALLGTGMSVSDIAKKLRCTPALVYNVRARMDGAGAKRGPGRPRASTPSTNGLAGLLDAVKGAERERAQLRVALERIHALVADALAR